MQKKIKAPQLKTQIKKTFSIGDEWLYYKLYCGRQVSDIILLDDILPFTKKAVEEGLISSWFFIRYSDPDFHIRVRFKLIDLDKLGLLIQKLKLRLSPYLKNGFIWDIQIHQYKRELERYGINTIQFAEEYFCIDSVSILKAKQLRLSDEDGIVFLVKYISLTLDELNFTAVEKYKFAEAGRLAFKTEFNANKLSTKQLDKKTRLIIDKERIDENESFSKILTSYFDKTEKLFFNILELQERSFVIRDFTYSLIHMSVNRYFNSNQRLYEFLIYDVLYKAFKKQLHTFSKP